MQVTIIEQYHSITRKHSTGHDVHQRGLARAVGADDGDELGGEDAQVGVVKDMPRQPTHLPARHIVADAPNQQFDIADPPDPGERRAIEGQFEWADINAVPRDQGTSTAHPCTVDIGAIGSAEVAQHDVSTCHFERRVTARDIRVVKHDLPWHRLTADRQAVIERQPIGQSGVRSTC